MQVLKDEHKEQLTNEKVNKPIPWFANDELVEHETLFLYRKEAGQNSLLDKFTIDLGMMPTFEDFQFAVKELHGGGIYEATARSVSGAYTKRLNFSLAGFPKRPKEEQQQTLAPVQPDNGLKEILLMMAEANRQANERHEKLLEKMAEKPPVPEADPFLMVERVAKLLGTTGATPPVPKSTLETLLEAKQIQELLGGSEMTAGTDGWGAVTAALGPLSEVLKENTINERLKLQIALKQSQNKAPAPVQAAQVTAPQTVQTIAAPKFAALIAKFKPVLAGLIPYVEQGQPPSLIASALLSSVPDTDKPELLEFLSRDDALNDMARLEPKVANHWDWFTELANELIELIQATPNDTGITAAPTAPTTTEPKVEVIGGSAGDTANATDHGKASTPRTRKPRNKGASVTTGETA
jgi:hypothetical protein